MTLKTFLNDFFEQHGPTVTPTGSDYVLTPEYLTQLQELLAECDDFADSQINVIPNLILGKPKRELTGYDEEGIPTYGVSMSTTGPNGENVITVKFDKETKFAPVVKIYSIALTPEMYDPNEFFKLPINTTHITPVLYDLETFKPRKQIIITFSPEQAQDNAIKQLRNELRELEKNEEKLEFTVNKDDDIKEQESEAQNVMETIKQEELAEKVKQYTEDMINGILSEVEDCLRNPSDHQIPAKRGILLRLTQDSIIPNDEPVRGINDIYLSLNK